MRLIPALLLALALAAPARAGTDTCGLSEESHCLTATGSYRIALPEGGAATKALVWLHGMGGSADAVMRNLGMIRRLHARGYALVAPDGTFMLHRPTARNWFVFDGREHRRDDIGFIAAVIEDVVARHGIGRERILLAGFSRGGSMVWDIACRAPRLARAYAPVAGAFWEPMATKCAAPVDLFHTHGWTDRTVPLEGRPLRDGALVQGDVFQSLFVLRGNNGCGNRQPEQAPVDGETDLWFRTWSDCAQGRIDLMLHPGGHSLPRGWLDRALDWFEARLETE